MASIRRTLTVEPLQADTFGPFGDVIEAGAAARQFAINQGYATRFHDLASIDVGEGQVLLNIFRALPRTLPMQLQVMERHPLGSQAFVAMAELPFLVVVAPPAQELVLADIRCFRAEAGQGVNYAKGVWHHPLIAIGRACDFLVIDRGGSTGSSNLDEIDVVAEQIWLPG
jgi:ureidoglycolate lyase